jgi:hypothetical protein
VNARELHGVTSGCGVDGMLRIEQWILLTYHYDVNAKVGVELTTTKNNAQLVPDRNCGARNSSFPCILCSAGDASSPCKARQSLIHETMEFAMCSS